MAYASHSPSLFAKALLRVCLFLSLTILAASSQANPVPSNKVTLQLKWKHQFQFAGYYAAIAQGYYREAGLEVELREAQPGHDPVEAVLLGEAEFGVGTSELVLLRARGKPVVVLAAIYQHSPLVLVTRRMPGINNLHDLVGKPIMIEPQSAELFAYFKAEGVDIRNLRIEHHTFKVEDIITGRVAAMSAYSTDEPFLIEKAGMESMTFTPRSGGIDFYGDNLFTTETELQKNPDRVKAFRAASLRGWDYAIRHPEEICELIHTKYSQYKSKEHLAFEAERTKQLMHTDLVEVGHMNPGRWKHITDTYAEFGMVPHNFDFTSMIYDPNPKQNLRWVYWTLGGAVVIALTAVGWMLPLYRLNRQLRLEIAERRKAEENLRQAKDSAEAADAAKSQYLAIMAHEVRTPLAGIVMMMEHIPVDKMEKQERDCINLIASSTESLLKLVNDTLDYSKLEAGCAEVENSPVSPKEILEEVNNLFTPSAEAKNIYLKIHIAPEVPPAVWTDPNRLRQILNNLVSNAIKFTAQGGVKISVRIKTPEENSVKETPVDQKLVFEVSDTGEGIAEEAIGRLFKPYVQADPSISRKHGGTGLGLSISQKNADLIHGNIAVKSELGRGSTFTLEISRYRQVTA